MKKNRKKKSHINRILVVIIVLLVLGIVVFFQTRPKLQVVSVVSEISDYNYYLESNATGVYKKYYQQLESELSNNKIDEENYAKLIAKLFLIDYYTLNNKITNKDIGGVDFIHTNLKEGFIEEASNTIYKYVKNNLYGKRRQKLPEVEDVEIIDIKNIKYKNKDYYDEAGYEIEAEIKYVKDLEYPEKVNLKLIHEDNKLVIVEIK